jgi:allophanate hydrolase
MVPACRSLDTISVFARTVDEALAVQRVITARDLADPYSRVALFPHLRHSATPPAMRVAMGDVAALCEPEVAQRYAAAGRLLDAESVDVGVFLEIARLLYAGPWVAERTAALRSVLTERPDILHPVTRDILQVGLDRWTADAFDAFHLLAQARRAAETLFSKYAALLLPTAPFCPTLAALQADPIGPNNRLGAFTNFANLCDLAGFAVPAGFGADGLPVGVMLLGPAWSEGRLAGLADQLHRTFVETVGATRCTLPEAAVPDALAADETALFCIGAHMSGLPLNQQITTLGGRFLRVAHTVPAYRLHALGNRPGMLRAVSGAVIEGEVWALPTVSIGALLAQVPAPLGFGTVDLQDGTCLGFLAEAAGVADAPDISRFGGWRAWLQAKGDARHE